VHLVYFDETGNTGTNFDDPQQKVFVLGALIVPEGTWLALEDSLQTEVDRAFPPPRPEGFEIHGGSLRNGEGYFRGISVNDRLAFRDKWLGSARDHGLKFVYRAIDKDRFRRWAQKALGSGVKINPYVVAFPLVARVVDDYLAGCPQKPLAIFVFDENKEVVHDIEKSLSVLRGIKSTLRLGRIVEKGFFIDSAKSLVLQLCDLCTYYARKKEEQAAGIPCRAMDEGGIAGIEPLVFRGNEAWQDVIAWITEQQKKERPGD
jgi:hypothetical protein